MEARPYSLMVGFFAISAVLWQRAGERRFITPALASFGLAEIAWTVQARRRIRWGVWAACLLASGPFLPGLANLLRMRELYGSTYFSRPVWSLAATTYRDYLGLDWRLTLVLIALFGIAAAHSLLGGGYTSRYGWTGLLGLVPGTVFVCRACWSTDGKLAPGRLAAHSRDYPVSPVVIGCNSEYLKAVTYAPAELHKTAFVLARYVPMRVQELAGFQAEHREFILYSTGECGWIPLFLVEQGYEMKLLSKVGAVSIYIVRK